METDKTIYKVGRKKTNELFFFTSTFADSVKKHTIALFEILPSILTTKHDIFDIYYIFITYL